MNEDVTRNNNLTMMQGMFKSSIAAGKAYMNSLGYQYKPWLRIGKKYRNEVCSCEANQKLDEKDRKKVKNCCGVSYEYDIKKD